MRKIHGFSGLLLVLFWSLSGVDAIAQVSEDYENLPAEAGVAEVPQAPGAEIDVPYTAPPEEPQPMPEEVAPEPGRAPEGGMQPPPA